MADNTLNSCLSESPGNPADNCSPTGNSKRKFCGYHYVPSESDEADTLKDKFWRDLEQGKLNFLNTVDMYTRVKRPGKLSEVDCFNVSNQDAVLLFDTAPVTCVQSSMSSVTGSLINARDASPPSSSGYESSSIPSIGSVSVTDSPTESDQHLHSLCDLSANVAQSARSVLKRKRKTLGKGVWPSSVKSKCRKHQTTPRNPSNRKKKTNDKFFRYVDASSEEADTLKDKFWRDLEFGNVSAITTVDLYSSVKVSRRTRQLSFSSVRNSDQPQSSTELPVISKNSETSETLECIEVSDVCVRCNEANSSCKSDRGAFDEHTDCYTSEHLASVADCKLLSPCSVSVERLPLSVDDVDLHVAGTIETCCGTVADNSKCRKAEMVSNMITENQSILPPDVSARKYCKQFWHSGRCRTGLRHVNKDTCTVERIYGSKTRVQRVHLSRLEINSSLPLCHVPSAFPSTWQRHDVCGWLEDDAVAEAG